MLVNKPSHQPTILGKVVYPTINQNWGVPKTEVPQNGLFFHVFSMEHPINVDDLGVPPLQETSNSEYFISLTAIRWLGGSY